MRRGLTTQDLAEENRVFGNSGGVSERNGTHGFVPAFLDTTTGKVYPCRDADGSLACFHRIDSLPDNLVIARDGEGHVVALKPTLVAGFSRDDTFYTRDQAASIVGALPGRAVDPGPDTAGSSPSR